MWAMARLKYECPALAKAVGERPGVVMANGTTQNVANTVYAFADLGYFAEAVFEELARHAERIAAQGIGQDIANILWALGIAGMVARHERTVRIFWDEAMSRPAVDFLHIQWSMLLLARLFAKSEGVELQVPRGSEQEKMLKKGASKSTESSERFERAVAKELSRCGFDGFEMEVPPFEAGAGGELMKVDIAWKEAKVALELDGPTHFLKSPRGSAKTLTRDGPSKAKARLLASLGWKVCGFSYLEAERVNAMSDDDRTQFWKAKLAEFGVRPAGQAQTLSALLGELRRKADRDGIR
eukprot:CAMPEP_0174902780 /NCGR_PEP_ID=MMETSP0167-20121228/39846_1 /TAXON_ID=38298 /ORGANISM="Rhodella maculata, Strain CCMP736" /LENGTH=296 /DNA_ID=CAMNT_0016144899 /DNA_START=44 /DNA_END=934 /DNA_ORIENTATION=+